MKAKVQASSRGLGTGIGIARERTDVATTTGLVVTQRSGRYSLRKRELLKLVLVGITKEEKDEIGSEHGTIGRLT